MADNTTAKFSVDISDLKKGIQEANRQIKLANAEFKAASASMDKWSNSTDGLTAKINQTEKVLAAQKKILSSYEQELKAVIEKYGENSKEADNMKIKYENQRAAVIKSEKALSDYKTALEKLEDEQKAAAEAANKQDTAYEALEKTIKAQKSELESLKSEYANVVLEQGKNSDAAKELASQIGELSADLNDNKNKMKEADAAADALDKSLTDTSKASDDASGGFTIMKGALADLVSAGIQKAIEGLKNLAKASYQAWQEYDAGADSIIAATGATGDAAEDLMDVYKNVSKNIVASYDDIGTAVGEINTRFGTTGDELQTLSEEFIKFADLNGVNLKTAIDNTSSAMAAWGVSAEDTSLMLDLLNKAGQDTGESVDSLAASLTSNAPALQEMGFNVSDAAMFLANLSKNGVDASSTMAGLKKALSNAAKEGTPMSEALAEIETSIKNAETPMEAITTATELFGSKAGAAIATAVREGNLSFEQLGTTMKDFEGNVNSTFENTLDAPDKLSLAIQGIKTDMADLVGRIMEEHGPQIEEFFNVVTEELMPKFEKGIGWLIDNLPLVGIAIAGLTATLVAFKTAAAIGSVIELWKKYEVATKLAAAGQWLINAAMSANPIGLIVVVITAVIAAFVLLWNKSEAFRNFWISLWESIKETISTFYENFLQPILSSIMDAFKNAFDSINELWLTVLKPMFEAIGQVFEWLWNNVIKIILIAMAEHFASVFNGIKLIWENILKPTFQALGDFFKWIWENILKPTLTILLETYTSIFNGIRAVWTNILKPVFQAIGDFFVSVWTNHLKPTIDATAQAFQQMSDSIAAVWDKLWNGILKPIINGILSGMETLANGVVRAMNTVIDALNGLSFTVPDWVPEFGGKTFGFNIGKLSEVSLPRLAAGGVLRRGQVGLLEGSGSEAVVPLENNKRWIAATAQALKVALKEEGLIAAGAGMQPATVTNNYNFTQNNNSPKALDALEIYRQTNSLLFNAEARLSNV